VSEQGSVARGVDRWAATIVPGGGTGLQAGPSGIVPSGTDSNWIHKYFKRIQKFSKL
jgi:hypothetical protein